MQAFRILQVSSYSFESDSKIITKQTLIYSFNKYLIPTIYRGLDLTVNKTDITVTLKKDLHEKSHSLIKFKSGVHFLYSKFLIIVTSNVKLFIESSKQ